ncbi:MAG TPA: hypothetical protein VGC80_05870 [Acetobacteraceae bacterium]
MTAAHMPPVPPEQRSNKADPKADPKTLAGQKEPKPGFKDTDRNLREQGRQANTLQNFTNQGQQQDR